MIVEDERNEYPQFDVSEFQQGEGKRSSHVDLTYSTDIPTNIANMMGVRTRIHDRQVYQQLKADLVEHMWSKFGRDQDNTTVVLLSIHGDLGFLEIIFVLHRCSVNPFFVSNLVLVIEKGVTRFRHGFLITRMFWEWSNLEMDIRRSLNLLRGDFGTRRIGTIDCFKGIYTTRSKPLRAYLQDAICRGLSYGIISGIRLIMVCVKVVKVCVSLLVQSRI
uniref:Uncharacterized protein n=1 Tax=Brassica oleracea var. oleracea TaxID=109376 RepID=A0A0D3BYX1_BRAOL